MKKKKIKKIEDVFTPAEAAEYLGVSRRTIERAAKDGKIVRHRINGGQRVFYKKTDIEGLLTPEK